MGKMTVTQFDTYQHKQAVTLGEGGFVGGGSATIYGGQSWSTRLESSRKPTCEGCGKDLDPNTAVYLGPIGPQSSGKLYCGYGCVEVPKQPASLRDRLDGALDRALAMPMPPGGVPACRGKLVEAVMETIRPMVDLLHQAARHPGLPFGGLARAEQVLRDVGLEPAEQE